MTDPGVTTPQPIAVTPAPAEVFFGALAFQQYAAEYLAAADALPIKENYSPVVYFLLCRAIELALKCFLRAQRVPMSEIKSRKLGHDLNRLHDRAKQEKLSRVLVLTPEQEDILSAANAYYGVKDFEYLPLFKAMTGHKDVPSLDRLRALAKTIVSPMEQVGMEATDTKGPLFV
jgi:hypothetical protein